MHPLILHTTLVHLWSPVVRNAHKAPVCADGDLSMGIIHTFIWTPLTLCLLVQCVGVYILYLQQEVFNWKFNATSNHLRCILVQLRNHQIKFNVAPEMWYQGRGVRLRGLIVSSFATVWEAIILSLSRIVLWYSLSPTLWIYSNLERVKKSF